MRIHTIENLFMRTNGLKPDRQSIWFLHGFADSGLAYKEVFGSSLVDLYNIYVVDLPGFGASPLNPNYISIKEHSHLLTRIIEQETTDQKEVNIVAHSLSALIGTWVANNLTGKINHYFNIEGNLTTADSYFSSKPLRYKTAEEFVASFNDEIFAYAKSSESYKHYYSSLRFADPEGMRNWSLTSQAHIKENKCGIEFRELACKKVYIWGDVDTPHETQLFIEQNQIPNQLFKGIGHWHMVENATSLYSYIHRTINGDFETE